ncbi:Rne/Rng family ribonuclease, partial [Kineococcus glutinatus]|uniref:Rne/Rng family ribonuclease n=1 Tax=Kineococcus glutinatus TaxID=1070872 RepID=UPI0031E5922B
GAEATAEEATAEDVAVQVRQAATEEAPTEQAPTEQAPTEQAPTEQAATEEAPTEEAARDAATAVQPQVRAAVAAGAPPTAVQPEIAAQVAEELAALAAVGGEDVTAADRTAPHDEPTGAAGDEDPLAGLPAAARATAVFFQAPDAERVPRRSRRASAPAGPPAPSVDDEDADETADDLDALDAAGDEDAVDDAEGSPRRRRRRGGRGRRSRVREEAAEDEADESARDEGAQEEPDAEVDAEPTAEVDAEPTAEDEGAAPAGRGGRRRRRGRGREVAEDVEDEETPGEGAQVPEDAAEDAEDAEDEEEDADTGAEGGSSRRRRRRRRRGGSEEPSPDDPPNTVVRVREPRRAGRTGDDEITSVKGSTRLEAKKQRRREGREAGRRRTILTEAEFLARRESVERVMVVREREGRTQIGVLEDGLLVEHYVARQTQASMVGNVYLGRVQNVLPSMEAAFVDVGKGRNAVLYAGEVNWDAAGLEGQPKRIELALKSGDSVLVQVTKDPVGHKGARLTSQISLPGRYLVYVPRGSMTGISRKLPDTERSRLKKVLRKVVPEGAGVIVRTAAEGISEEELAADVERLQARWAEIEAKTSGSAPALLHGEPDLTVRVVRDVFNEDFSKLVVAGDTAWATVSDYVASVAPDLLPRVERWEGELDVFAVHRIDEQLAKALDRKVYLPSGGSLVIDRTEAMTVVDVNTGKFTGAGGNLEETVTRNNLEAAEEIVRQLRLRDIGGIIVIDFIDMVLESNRDLVLRRLTECLGRDRTKHQVAEVTSLGLVQMTRKRAGQGLLEAFSETCEACSGRGLILHDEPVEKRSGAAAPATGPGRGPDAGPGSRDSRPT